jgi:hypothetical protein
VERNGAIDKGCPKRNECHNRFFWWSVLVFCIGLCIGEWHGGYLSRSDCRTDVNAYQWHATGVSEQNYFV